MVKYQKIAFLFPGQGAQYPGMTKDFIENFSAARLTLEEADDLLERRISELILNGPEKLLTQTANSQVGIFIASTAILRVVQELFNIQPAVCAGLSLGEYVALTAADYISFIHCLPIVQHRGTFMNEAAEKTQGTMAVVIGLEAQVVEEMVKELQLPQDLWVANYNCPGQVVISGTLKGIEAGTGAAQKRGAKRVLPLSVQGAFHSGLMQKAEYRLASYIESMPLKKGNAQLVMNVPGAFVNELDQIKQYLIQQVTHSVRWEQGIRAMDQQGVDLYIEFGPGQTLSGMNKRMVQVPTINIDKVEDLDKLAQELS